MFVELDEISLNHANFIQNNRKTRTNPAVTLSDYLRTQIIEKGLEITN